jgi:hypothetical protein
LKREAQVCNSAQFQPYASRGRLKTENMNSGQAVTAANGQRVFSVGGRQPDKQHAVAESVRGGWLLKAIFKMHLTPDGGVARL